MDDAPEREIVEISDIMARLTEHITSPETSSCELVSIYCHVYDKYGSVDDKGRAVIQDRY